jgi:hypothetical protein
MRPSDTPHQLVLPAHVGKPARLQIVHLPALPLEVQQQYHSLQHCITIHGTLASSPNTCIMMTDQS